MRTWWTLALLLQIMFQTSWAGFLFRSSPGGDGVQPAGLWGGDVDVHENGIAKDLFEKGYHRLDTNNSMLSSLDLTSFSYDPILHGVILEVEDPSASSKVVAYGSICEDTGLFLLAGNVQFVSPDHPYMLDAKCSWRCGWNAFAFYDGEVYFVLSAVFGTIPALLNREIQVRRLNRKASGCASKLASASSQSQSQTFDILACSELLTTLHASPYAWPNPVIDVFAGSSMTTFRQTPDSHLQLYVQLFNKTMDGVHMTLHQVTLSTMPNEQVTSKMLYSTVVATLYSGQWRVRGLGEISYRDGVLCWTAAEELLCGNLQDKELTEVKTLVSSGEAYRASVCTGAIYPYPTGKVLTGVAIATTRNPFSLYFGCYSETAGVGGMGLLQISATYAGAKKEILNVTSGNKKVYGGTLLLLDDFAKECGKSATTEPQNSRATSSQSQQRTRNHGDVAGIIGSCSVPTAPCILLLPFVIMLHLVHIPA